jgi:hypothetical protein
MTVLFISPKEKKAKPNKSKLRTQNQIVRTKVPATKTSRRRKRKRGCSTCICVIYPCNDHSLSFPIPFQRNLLARLFHGQQCVDGPRLIDVAGWYIGVLERISIHEMSQRFLVPLNCVQFRVMPPDPGSQQFPHHAGFLGGIRVMAALLTYHSELLKACDAFKPMGIKRLSRWCFVKSCP